MYLNAPNLDTLTFGGRTCRNFNPKSYLIRAENLRLHTRVCTNCDTGEICARLRRNRIEKALGIPNSTGMTFIFTGVRLLGSRVAGFRVLELTFGDHFSSRLEISQFSCCELVPNCFNDWSILDSILHRHPTHILSDNHCHPMCIGHGIGTHKSQKLTIMDTVSTFHWFYPLIFRQSDSIIQICRNQVLTDTPHIFCLTTTAIPCVFLKQ